MACYSGLFDLHHRRQRRTRMVRGDNRLRRSLAGRADAHHGDVDWSLGMGEQGSLSDDGLADLLG
jgi:hypothetical protein